MLTNRIPKSVFEARWRQAQQAAQRSGVEALVVWSRGGGSVDAAQDVIYLANYCSSTPLVPDLDGYWSGLSSAAVVIPVQGEPVLVIDSPECHRDVVAIQDVRPAATVPQGVAQVISALGLSGAGIGLVAGDAMLVGPYRRLLAACPGVSFTPMDKAIEALRRIKTPLEMELLREAADIGCAAMNAMMRHAMKPGVTEAEAVAMAYQVAVAHGVAMIDAPTASGRYSHFYASGQAPNWSTRRLAAGELFHCDLYGAAVEGYRFDFSRTVVCGGSSNSDQQRLIEGAVAAVQAGISAARPGAKARDIWQAVQSTLESLGMASGYGIAGHGYGLGWEGPWLVPGNDDVIEAGMALTIETMAGIPGVGRAKFEQDVLVHTHGCEILTAACPAYFS